MTLRGLFQSKYATSQTDVVFDFTSDLAVGETIAGATVTPTTYSGVDEDPQDMTLAAASVSGPRVTQRVVGGLSGVIYLLTCQATTSTGQVLRKPGLLAIISEAP